MHIRSIRPRSGIAEHVLLVTFEMPTHIEWMSYVTSERHREGCGGDPSPEETLLKTVARYNGTVECPICPVSKRPL